MIQPFELIIKSIHTNLRQALQILQQEEPVNEVAKDALAEAYGHLEAKYTELVNIRNRELEAAYKPIEPEMLRNLQEARLISDQLKWLETISGNLKNAILEIENGAVVEKGVGRLEEV